ncbi:lipopolysaccharide kinase (Kdo/WaaP) family protein [Pseudomonas duriflava]|uniref:Lipopolysaccharide kinase (Kdo/WaaP) family protein n=1 Tax=Pseudomonas duriflava TaxID=459528 RepID=A0A562QDF7_9PSED|nr:lipopolysaccharide kinase InaA family protein [Pseudomonas duriflava]TWI54200.1 lipopolysaccharide kinase (Kdo/WaaP) family protein [Pseudomonas duriflava]
MADWHIDPSVEHIPAFTSLETVFALEGERLTRDPLSEVVRVSHDGVRYYVKRYSGAGKGLRRYLGRPRVKAEWQNLKRFAKWGIPTADVVAWGLERSGGQFERGAMITREIPNTDDLAVMAQSDDLRLSDAAWVDRLSSQLAHITRQMHDHHFAHNDLKWRNLLVDREGVLYLIDCPSGTFWFGSWLRRRIIKDLACLDKVAKYKLSRTQRLRFYLRYKGRERLRSSDKERIARVLNYFKGRE